MTFALRVDHTVSRVIFRGEVDRAFPIEGLKHDQLTEHYLVHLLAAFAAQPIEDRPGAIRLSRYFKRRTTVVSVSAGSGAGSP